MSEHHQLFTAKRDLCRSLLELSRGQEALIAAEDYTGLLALLHRKQALLTQLDRLKATHAAALAGWPTERNGLPPDTRAACESLLSETESLIAKLVAAERTSTEQLVDRRDATRTELQAVTTGATVNDAYRDTLAPATHRHLDIDT